MSGPYEVDRHQVALRKAREAISDLPKTSMLENSDMESAIKAYLDASGMVMVPRDTVTTTFINSSIPHKMIDAGYDVLERCYVDLTNGIGPDWDYGMEAVAVYRAMIAAAPNPFEVK